MITPGVGKTQVWVIHVFHLCIKLCKGFFGVLQCFYAGYMK